MKIGVVGYPGKMGQAILSEIVKYPDISLVMIELTKLYQEVYSI
jgi:dihydrodipicolinate reductase